MQRSNSNGRHGNSVNNMCKDVAKGKEKARKKKRTEAVKRREADTLRDYGDTGYGAGRY